MTKKILADFPWDRSDYVVLKPLPGKRSPLSRSIKSSLREFDYCLPLIIKRRRGDVFVVGKKISNRLERHFTSRTLAALPDGLRKRGRPRPRFVVADVHG